MPAATRRYRSTDERRIQITDATIDVLAERGYAATSFERIREKAGLSSTRMISYHFVDKAALMAAVVERVVQAAAAVMVPAMEAQSTWRGKLQAYIAGNLRFLADNRAGARAVIEVISNSPPTENGIREDTSTMLLSLLLNRGQESGEFGPFDPTVVARSIRATIDNFAATMPESADRTDAAIQQIVALFDRGTRKKGTR